MWLYRQVTKSNLRSGIFWQNQNYSRLAGLTHTGKKHPYVDVSNSEGCNEKRNYTAMSVMLLIIMIFSISSSESCLAVLCILAI